MKHLTHLSCELGSIEFGRFEQIIKDFFPAFEVVHFTATCDRNNTHLNMDKWKQLIMFHMPNLRILDIQLEMYVGFFDCQLAIETEINQFTSSFWIERQWFFAHRFYEKRYGNRCIFYSTNPYR